MVPADTLVCDTAQIAVWQSDPAFAYSRELIAPEINVLEWFSRWFGKLLDKIFGNTLVAEYSEVVLICIAVLILVRSVLKLTLDKYHASFCKIS